MPTHDLFLSYNRSDRTSIEEVRRLLNAQGVSTFIDYKDLYPGMPWPQALERALDSVSAVAVFIGPELGTWQEREMYYALDRQGKDAQAGRRFPVIPVLLPESDVRSGFLFLNTWIDLREDLTSAEGIGQIVRTIRGDAEPKPVSREVQFSPYQGLKPFREANAAFFFGREQFSQRLLEKVCSEKGITAVIGPSGSGKSSIVHAGLLPLLRRQRPPSRTWDAVWFTPGEKPFHRLAAALMPLLHPEMSAMDRLDNQVTLGDRLARGTTLIADVTEEIIKVSKGTDRLLVFIDQFEELITSAKTTEDPQSSVAGAFVKAMIEALQGRAPIEFVFTMRSEFYGRIIGLSRELSDRLEQSIVNVGPMTESELERAIVEPARKVGLGFEPGLVQRLLTDLGREPGQLPLLEFALWQLWDKREGRVMSHAAYERFGGVSKAINSFAHAKLQGFNSEEQQIVRRIFTRLVRVTSKAEGEEDTSRRAFLNEFDPTSRQILDRLADARLLVTSSSEAKGQETVEVSHEALIREWNDLRVWLEQDREFLLWRQRLRSSTTEWQRVARDHAGLLRGAFLKEAEGWRNSRETDLNEEECDFIGSSVEHRQKGVLEEERRRRKRLFAVAAGTVLVAVFAVLAWVLWQRAADQQRIAMAGTLLSRANAIISNEPAQLDQAALLAMESLNLYPSARAQPILRQAIGLLPKQIDQRQVDCDGEAKLSVGGRFVTCLNRSSTSLRVLSVADGKDVAQRPIEETAAIANVAASPDGKSVGIGLRRGRYKLIDTQTGMVKSESKEGISKPDDDEPDATVAFSASGSRFAAGVFNGSTSTVHVVNAENGVTLHSFPLQQRVLAVTFSADGRFLAALQAKTSGPEVTIFDLSNAHSWRITAKASLRVLALSPAASFIALLDINNAVHVKEAGENTEEEEKANWTHKKDTATNAVAFSDDGKYTASGSDDGTARVMETSTGLTIAIIPAGSPVRSVTFTANNDLVVASDDKTVRTFNVLKRPAFEALSGDDVIAISPGGRYLSTAAGSSSPELAVVERATGQTLKPLPLPQPNDVLSSGVIRFSVDEAYLVADEIHHGMTFLNIATGRTGHRKAVAELVAQAVSGDGKTIAWSTADKILTFPTEDTRDNSYRDSLPFRNARVLELSSDGQLVAAAAEDPVITVFDIAANSENTLKVPGTDRVKKAAFSPDGRYLAISMENSNLFITEIESRMVWPLERANAEFLVFSGDGNTLAVSGYGTSQSGSTVRLIETATRATLADITRESSITALAFGAEGSYLELVDDISITRHYLRNSDLTQQACQLLTRNFSNDEWQALKTGSSYRRTCPNLP